MDYDGLLAMGESWPAVISVTWHSWPTGEVNKIEKDGLIWWHVLNPIKQLKISPNWRDRLAQLHWFLKYTRHHEGFPSMACLAMGSRVSLEPLHEDVVRLCEILGAPRKTGLGMEKHRGWLHTAGDFCWNLKATLGGGFRSKQTIHLGEASSFERFFALYPGHKTDAMVDLSRNPNVRRLMRKSVLLRAKTRHNLRFQFRPFAGSSTSNMPRPARDTSGQICIGTTKA